MSLLVRHTFRALYSVFGASELIRASEMKEIYSHDSFVAWTFRTGFPESYLFCLCSETGNVINNKVMWLYTYFPIQEIAQSASKTLEEAFELNKVIQSERMK